MSFISPAHFSLLLVTVFGGVIAVGFYGLLWSANPLSYHFECLLLVWCGFFAVLSFYKNKAFKHDLCLTAEPSARLLFWVVILAYALLFRFQVLFAIPFLADDYQRYLFDGKLILSGVNPYAALPMSYPELGGLAIPKPDVKTIYPPLAQGLFAVTSWLGGTLLHWRLMNLIPDLLGAVIVYRLLALHGFPSHWLVLWLWNPLILKEGLHGAHLDIWTMLAVLLFVYWARLQRMKLAALALSGAVLIKLIPLLLLPAWLIQLTSLRDRLMVIALVSMITAIGFACFFPWHPFGNLVFFLQHIQGYGVLFQILLDSLAGRGMNTEWIKWLLTSLGGAVYVYWILILKRYQSQGPSRLPEVFVLLFVFSSMGFPWYLLAALPWLLLHGHWLWWVFFALSQLIFYSHQLQEANALLNWVTGLVLVLAIYHQRTIQSGKRYV